jgi:hypothetical protein
MFQAGREDVSDAHDRGRPAILPFAVFGVLMLLVGFAGGYFVRDRAASVPPAAVETKAPAMSGSATGSAPATADRPGPYSEQPVTRQQTPAATSAARPAATGQIVIRSQPSNAGVTINGIWRGRTPLTLDKAALGVYVVRVVQPGYRVARDEFTLSASEPSHTFTARLERAVVPADSAAPSAATPARTGSIYVDSRPRGATVTIDGRNVGVTPLTLGEVAVGPHVVRIELTGKRPVTANPRVVAGQVERVTVSLEDRPEA